MTFEYSKLSHRIVRSEIREILKFSLKPGVISFAGGLPDASLFPIQEICDITSQVLQNKGFQALQYGPTRGEDDMLKALIKHMAQFDEEAQEENICITSSSQQGLDLLSLLFLDEDSPIILELPSYLGAIQAYRRSGAKMIGVPMDDEGIVIDSLKRELERLDQVGTPPRFIYVIPDFQNPSGITMSLKRRQELIQIAREKNIPLIEDSPYRELVFSGDMLPSLWSLAKGKGVVMLKTFSKMLFPGMRMGWMVADSTTTEKIIMLKQSVDLCTPSFNQLILAEYLNRGQMSQTIQKAIHCYQPKSTAMIDALEKYMPDSVSWSKPCGGMFLWVTLPDHIDTKQIFMKAIDNHVAYVIGRPFHCDLSGANTMRLCYSFPSVKQIDEGIKRLAQTIKESL